MSRHRKFRIQRRRQNWAFRFHIARHKSPESVFPGSGRAQEIGSYRTSYALTPDSYFPTLEGWKHVEAENTWTSWLLHGSGHES